MAQADSFEATSPDIPSGKPIDRKFSYGGFGNGGENLSPAVNWRGAPAGTGSFALLVHDPDAPTGGAGWWHWLVVDIPATASALEQGAGTADGTRLPAGCRQITNDYGEAAWGGPCPPVGDPPHRYLFTVYALDVTKLELPPDPTAGLAGFMVNMHVLARSTFMGTFAR